MARWTAIAVGVPLVSRLDPRVLPAPVWFVLVWLVGLAALSLLVTPGLKTGTGEFFFILILCLPFVAAGGVDDISPALEGIAAGLGVSAALCVAQWLGWHPIAQNQAAPPGLFYNPEVLAELAAIVFVWAVASKRWWAVVATIIPLVLSHSRIGVAVAALGLLYALRPQRWVLALLLTLGAAVGALLLAVSGPDKFASACERVVIWIAMAHAIEPLGRGLGWVSVALPQQQFVHSDALQAVVEMGVGAVGLALIPFFAFNGIKQDRAVRAAFLACCAEVLVSFPLRVPATGFVAALLAGWLVGRGPCVRVGVPDGGIEDGPGLFGRGHADWADADAGR